ncbi:MAG: hypothetical protein COA58_10795 [Bacteroidetes bacterium]|nr:MAG: hypothetical protein COA58_10795 [Bacteroidota bacterium]
MKVLAFIFLLGLSNYQTNKEKSIDQWVNEIVNDMIQLNNLEKYSLRYIPSGTNIDFILVDAVKNVQIHNSSISMLIDHGSGTYCSKLKFKYVQIGESFRLVFAPPTLNFIAGKKVKYVTPWTEKKRLCQ